ncbi:ANTAR domain-containing protein [Streptomyces sp. NPDC006372]|uniref:ANTAR domain-containing protein n=1 Tax=Streptomyces sp. NPDC006372 TaxID=3155599 RepID=UPI0033A828D1
MAVRRETTPPSCAWTGTAPNRRNPGLLRGDRQKGLGEGTSHAVDSHSTVVRAIGVLTAVHGISPSAAFETLREVSHPLPEPVLQELEAAMRRCMPGDAPEEPR